MKNLLKENERLDDLEINNLKIIQNKNEFCFGIDAVLLSDFVNIKKGAKLIDLCTGTGIIPILVNAKNELSYISALEYQEHMVDMAKRSILFNKLENKIEIKKGDVCKIKDSYKQQIVDVITCNPPYMQVQDGIKNKMENVSIARHEILLKFEDIAKASKYLLKEGGKLYLVHRPHRLVEIINTLNEVKIEVKRIRFVYPYKNKDANMVLIEAVKGGGSFLKVEKPLVVYNENGEYTEEILKIYGKNNRS